jgi:hypothetical protein
MAINTTLRKNIAKYIKLGDKVTYSTRNDENEKKTLTDVDNLFEQAIKGKNILEILQAIYDVSADNRFNGAPFAISNKGRDFFVTDIKSAKTEKVTVSIDKTSFKSYDKITKKETIIELKDVITTAKTIIKPLREQLLDGLKTAKNDADVIRLMENILNTK